jgi:hypothetical protein
MLRLLTAVSTHSSPVTFVRTESRDRLTDHIRDKISSQAICRIVRWSGTVKTHDQFGDWT